MKSARYSLAEQKTHFPYNSKCNCNLFVIVIPLSPIPRHLSPLFKNRSFVP